MHMCQLVQAVAGSCVSCCVALVADLDSLFKPLARFDQLVSVVFLRHSKQPPYLRT
jgi:hypothetical protein